MLWFILTLFTLGVVTCFLPEKQNVKITLALGTVVLFPFLAGKAIANYFK